MTALALALLLASDPAPTLAPPATEGTEVVLHDVATVTGRDRLRELTASLSTGSWDGVAEQAGVQLDGLAEARTVMLAREQHLVDALRELVPVTEDPGYRVEALGDGRLAVIGTALQQDAVRGILRAIDAFQGYVCVESTVLEAPPGTLASVDPALHHGSLLSEGESQALVESLRAGPADVLVAPKVVFTPLQSASLTAGEQIAYIADYEVADVGDAVVADPVIDTVWDGVRLDVHALPIPEGRLALSADLKLARVARPIPTVETTLGIEGAAPVTIQLPSSRVLEASGRFDLRPGESVLLSTESAEDGGREVLVLLQVQVVAKPPGDGR